LKVGGSFEGVFCGGCRSIEFLNRFETFACLENAFDGKVVDIEFEKGLKDSIIS